MSFMSRIAKYPRHRHGAPKGSTARRSLFAALAACVGAICVSVACAGGSYALLNAGATVNAGIVTSGKIQAQLGGFDALSNTYQHNAATNSDSTSVTQPVIVTNAGNVDARYQLSAAVATGWDAVFNSSVSLFVWPVSSASDCTPLAAAGGTTSHWSDLASTMSALSGTVQAQHSAAYCVRTTMTSATGVASGRSISATLHATLSVGGWTSQATQTASQTFVDNVAPTAPASLTATATSGTLVTLVWPASSDNVGVAAYDVYRDGVLLASVTTAGTTDTVDVGSTHVYAVGARDAAGNQSVATAQQSVTTPIVKAGSWYQIVNVNSGQCIDAKDWGATSGTALLHAACNSPTTGNQTWQFTSSDAGYYTVTPGYTPATSLVWDVNGASTTPNAQVFLWTAKDSGIDNQQWQLKPAVGGGGRFQIISRHSGLCLDAGGDAATGGANTMRQTTCVDGNNDQLFTFAALAAPTPPVPALLPTNGSPMCTTASSSANLSWSNPAGTTSPHYDVVLTGTAGTYTIATGAAGTSLALGNSQLSGPNVPSGSYTVHVRVAAMSSDYVTWKINVTRTFVLLWWTWSASCAS